MQETAHNPDPAPDSACGGNRTATLILLRVSVYVFLFLTMYVFSIGPMYWRWYESYAMFDSHEEAVAYSDTVMLFYMPLLTACDYCDSLGEFVNWYIDFWV